MNRTTSSRLQQLRSLGRPEGKDDAGLTIIELVVAMMIFTVVLAIYSGALMSMSKTTARAQGSVDASDALRKTFNVLDHEVRYATSINRPVKGISGAWYVEFEATDLPNEQPTMCYQWRLDPTTNILSTRTRSGTDAVTAWQGVSWDVKAAGGGSPFVFVPIGGSVLRQSLTVRLMVDGLTTGELAEQRTTFIARNSSEKKSLNNPDSNSDGVSDSPVCTVGMDHP